MSATGKPTKRVGYAALLHGVNVGGNRKVPMADFRALLSGLGYTEVVSHLNSGNAAFATTAADPVTIAARIHDAIQATLDLDVVVQVRTAAQLQQVVDHNPLPAAVSDPSHFLAVFLAQPLPADPENAALPAGFDPSAFPDEDVVLTPETLYLWYRKDIGHSKLTLDTFGRKTKALGTGRNWNTVLKLLALTHDRTD